MAGVMAPPAFGSQSGPEDALRHIQSDFLAILSHEIRTPLTGILGMADLLLETELSGVQQGYVSAARDCAEGLLEDLGCALKFSELSTGHAVLEESEFNLGELLRSAAAVCQRKAQAKSLSFSVELAEGMPQCVIGDGSRLREILTQVLANAVKFTQRGEAGMRAWTEAAPAGRVRLMLEVYDTGIGITPNQAREVFESFRQGESGLARRYPGLGMGLALVQRLLQLMRGEVAVESEPGKGSLIRLTIPLRLPPEHVPPKPVSRLRRVLVVDENPVSRRRIRQLLSGRQYDVESAPNRASALSEAARRRYEAVLLDMRPPGLAGLETARALRSLPGYGQTPLIALLPADDEKHRALCLAGGLQTVLAGPIEAAALLPALERFLG